MLSRPSIEVTKEPDLLDGWWTSDYLFSLERRAIFSNAWIPVTHRSRFTKPGDYISFDLAGFPIIIILGKDRITRAFHNVCRHRAYTITKKSSGSSLVLGCRYHGWSYDTKGSLVKAPQFDGLDGFDKSENGLFKIRTCTDRGGFVHINLNAGADLELPDCEQIVKFANEYGITSDGKWLAGWESSGGFNWKTSKVSKPEKDIPQLPILKAHLKLERLVGHEVFPSRKEEGKSDSFCRAEKSECFCIITDFPGHGA
ncbi:ISP domain-containing protein [Amniculicola lignicola CBS 123094]|uniref:ISP domain-containing protein n=1 Tax=Amniculicola lignicola CBS 123094 TaxID=1392246 RepID=A0A6A5W034_9PLEO|nr:ISP domain-containing protein [Amniculicola lignicola CBS 123094]